MLQLRLTEATQLISTETDNAIALYMLDEINFMQAFTSEKSEDYTTYLSNAQSRISLLEKCDNTSAWYRYCLSDICMHRAVVYAQNGDYMKAVWDIRKSLKYIEENISLHSDFNANYKIYGTLQVVLGTVPDNWKWGSQLLGISANASQGFSDLRELLYYAQNNSDFEFKNETIILYALLQTNIAGNPAEAMSTMQKAGFPQSGESLQYYALLHVCAYGNKAKTGRSYITNYPSGKNYQPFARVNYLSGLIELENLNTTEASAQLLRYASSTKGKNYLKDCYQKLSWAAWLNGDSANYALYHTKISTSGQAKTDADKQAQKEYERNILPDRSLLKARLLCDGGLYTEALAQINTVTIDSFAADDFHREEYLYRKGKVYQQLKNNTEAINSYKQLVQLGTNTGSQFMPNAALQLGSIYSGNKQTDSARKYYQLAISYKNHDYENSIEQRAKAGLNACCK